MKLHQSLRTLHIAWCLVQLVFCCCMPSSKSNSTWGAKLCYMCYKSRKPYPLQRCGLLDYIHSTCLDPVLQHSACAHNVYIILYDITTWSCQWTPVSTRHQAHRVCTHLNCGHVPSRPHPPALKSSNGVTNCLLLLQTVDTRPFSLIFWMGLDTRLVWTMHRGILGMHIFSTYAYWLLTCLLDSTWYYFCVHLLLSLAVRGEVLWRPEY